MPLSEEAIERIKKLVNRKQRAGAYEQFYRRLSELLDGPPERCKPVSVKIERESFMPLVCERMPQLTNWPVLVSLAHYGKQNGDLMRDPEIVFAIHPQGTAEPISFQNDYMGTYQEVYTYDEDGKRQGIRLNAKLELKAFAQRWFANLRAQGFLSEKNKVKSFY